MAKLRDLITEREFGEPLPTFKGVMKQHQVNKLQEDWWDNMSPEDQAEYIQAHPGSDKAQASKEKGAGGDEPEKITKGPGGYGDRGNVRGGDQRNFGEPDDEEYFKSMMGGGDDKPDSVEPEEEPEEEPKEKPSYKPTGPSMAYGAEWGDDPQASPGYTRRTGDELDDDELNQETLTIDGKQFRRISEGVEQKPKSKYEFSEFYQRFKK